jgi:anti-anti-sigma factor
MISQIHISRIETIVAVEGPLTGDSVEELHRVLTELSTGSCLTISLDLSRSPVLNSASLGKILFFRRKLEEQRKTLRIQGCSEGVHRILTAMQFNKLMDISLEPHPR